ncbi:YHS domain-containing (seleno)protein [Pedobacter frigiditerrae]|uniref:YHS domain-containing (seleno)protein n=1 Tax=Pedobacter frigiditerrae TaxID=2530452 RepID=UPI00292FBAAB|nr:YHS domain-containing (seleno)protein [Pedobacter frigiditerrae]
MKKLLTITAMLLMTVSLVKAQKSEIFCTAGKAIKGYDPVAFFTESKPVKGADSLSYSYKDATWLFSSKANLESFKKSPEKYSPQYGGYCAYGTADGHKAPTQTDTWTIVDGKLYFNYNGKVKEMWTKQQAAFIEKANTQWPLIKDKP